MTNEQPLDNSDIQRDQPTEDGENKDTGGHGSEDTGDEPTEADENLDSGDGSKDTGDED